MSFDPEIGSLRARMSRARADRDAGQASGNQNRYIAACLELQTLERAMDRLHQMRIASAASGTRSS